MAIAGPTAVGKTEICLKLADYFHTEIISSDSRQFYREMEIGTAKPSPEELARVPHHFINSLSIWDSFDVKRFEKEAIELLHVLFNNNDLVIMTGGSGLFLDVIMHGMDEIPDVDPAIRQSLILSFEEKGIAYLQDELKKRDAVYFGSVDLNNPQRLMRALEVCIGTGKPYSAFRQKKTAKREFETILVGLERERAVLYQRIDQRMDQMIAAGLFSEAEALFPNRHLNALQTLGYSEIFSYLEGEYDYEEAVRLLKRNSRRYAKRQLTWFKRYPEMEWFHPDQFEAIVQYVQSKLEADKLKRES